MRVENIIEDTRNRVGSHVAKNDYWSGEGVNVFRSKLAVGDYCLPPRVSVDSKASIQELAMDIDQEHERFRRELIAARDMGTKLVILVENAHGIRCLADLARWTEPENEFRRRKFAQRRIDGKRIAKACITMQDRYGCAFAFCSPEEAGEKVLRILGKEAADGGDPG